VVRRVGGWWWVGRCLDRPSALVSRGGGCWWRRRGWVWVQTDLRACVEVGEVGMMWPGGERPSALKEGGAVGGDVAGSKQTLRAQIKSGGWCW
jgi:hypothetical protein